MTITIQILPDAFDTGGALEDFRTRANPSFARPLQFPEAPLPIGVTGIQGAPGPGFIASASRQVFQTNIREDGTFPPPLEASPPGATGEIGTQEQMQSIIVHVSPTSGSTIIRGNNWLSSRAEFDPAYGLDVTTTPVTLDESVFETAINDPIGGQFLANLQDLVVRSIIEVSNDGVVMSAEDIRAFDASA